MRRVCYICGVQYGEKEPLEDKRVTSGLCDQCIPKEMEKIKRWMKDQDQNKEKKGDQ